MNQFYLNKLEYNQILDKLSCFSKTFLGKEMCLNLKPSFDSLKVKKTQAQTLEAFTLLMKYGKPPIDNFDDINLSLKKVSSNHILSAKELLDIAKVLMMSRNLSAYFSDIINESKAEDFSNIQLYFSNLYCNLEIEKDIFSKIIDENTIDDKASTALFSIRKNRKNLEGQIKDKLYKIIHSSTYSKCIMDPIITIRNNRFVIPVKNEYRSAISGFIHDISSSGSTVFIEPTTIFDINNQINSLKLDENLEIEKVLTNLSNKIEPIVNNLYNDVSLIATIDFLFAKAEYAKSIDAISPIISDKKQFYLVEARHPLIAKDQVVPINISLGLDNTSLVITGPNTGGKTVTLKTIGLLHLMVYSGLMIPANEKSILFVFDNIFADIGDDQSLSESLSTFSSHMKNIIEITKSATCQSLILLDELGSGTDPIEGSSLAISILEFFKNLGSLCVSTTHYQELKNYVITHPGFMNASAEFDIENLKPTYHIILGVPGKSNAFAISNKLGLDHKILERARSFINSDETKIEDILKQIYDDKKAIEIEKQNIEDNSKAIKILKEKLQQDNQEKIDAANKLIENAKIEARDILLSAKDEATSIIRQINDISRSNHSSVVKDLNNLRNKLNTSIRSISSSNLLKTNASINVNNLIPGSRVIVTNLNQHGIISGKVSNNRVQVLIGNSKLNVDIQNLELDNTAFKKQLNNHSKVTSKSNIKQKNISNEINVIGLNVDEAIYLIDKYLDDCSLTSLKTIHIVHGKGTGKLRTGIQNYLKKHKHVKSFRAGTFGEGEMGVTVVEIK